MDLNVDVVLLARCCSLDHHRKVKSGYDEAGQSANDAPRSSMLVSRTEGEHSRHIGSPLYNVSQLDLDIRSSGQDRSLSPSMRGHEAVVTDCSLRRQDSLDTDAFARSRCCTWGHDLRPNCASSAMTAIRYCSACVCTSYSRDVISKTYDAETQRS